MVLRHELLPERNLLGPGHRLLQRVGVGSERVHDGNDRPLRVVFALHGLPQREPVWLVQRHARLRERKRRGPGERLLRDLALGPGNVPVSPTARRNGES